MKTYTKPVVTRVEMRPVEAALSACKAVGTNSQAFNLGGAIGCVPEGCACRDVQAS